MNYLRKKFTVPVKLPEGKTWIARIGTGHESSLIRVWNMPDEEAVVKHLMETYDYPREAITEVKVEKNTL